MRIRYASTSATALEQRARDHVADFGTPCRARAPAAGSRRSARRARARCPCDLRGHQVRALGHDDRRAHPSRRYSSATAKWVGLVMTTVAFWHAGEHPAADHLALDAAHARLDLGIAFRVLEVVLDFLLGHHQRLGQLVALEEVVAAGNRQQADRRLLDQAASPRPTSRPRHRLARPGPVAALPRDDTALSACQPRMPISVAATDIRSSSMPPRRGPQPLEAGRRIEAVQVELQRLGGDVPAALRGVKGDHRDDGGQGDRGGDHADACRPRDRQPS